MDFVLDYFVLHLDSEPSYRKFMDNMLCKNEQYEFAPVSSYEEFKRVLFQSLGGEEKFRRDYETIITFLLYASNKFYWDMVLQILPFLAAYVRVRRNGLSFRENTMHMLSLHATSIGGYLSQSWKEDFHAVLKKVRIVRENTGYKNGVRVLFARVHNPFLGSRICPLASCYQRLRFPPLTEKHTFLVLKNFGNALGVVGVNDREHTLDGKPLADFAFMKNPTHWQEQFSHPHCSSALL